MLVIASGIDDETIVSMDISRSGQHLLFVQVQVMITLPCQQCCSPMNDDSFDLNVIHVQRSHDRKDCMVLVVT